MTKVLAITGLGLWACAGHSSAADLSLSEYQVKALFLFNFAKYVDWPDEAFDSPNAPITIGLIGENKFGDYLVHAVEGKTIGGRPLEVRSIKGAEELPQCHILFISSSEKMVAELLKKLQDLPVLTVGEQDQFTQLGGIIGFLKKDGKIRLDINLKAARQANLKISSKLLSVADSVKGKP